MRCLQTILRAASNLCILDEVSALVLDMGTSSTRLGYAGEDTPRCIIPTSYGYIPRTVTSVGEDGMQVESQARDLYVGENGVNRWRPGMEVANPMTDSLSEHELPLCNMIGLIDTV